MLVDKYIELAKEKNPDEPEFYQTVEEVLTSIEPVLKAHPEYIENCIIERLIEPERMITFRVSWVDDKGKIQVNRGYRCQYSSTLGPYKGGIRFNKNVYSGIIKFLAFEQIFKNSLTGFPMGGGKGGSDFDPNGKSDMEIMRFCQSFMSELYKYIGPDTDVPAGDLGVSGKEIGYLFGEYKKLTGKYDGTLTGKPLTSGGLKGRAEATGYGIVFFLNQVLKHKHDIIKGKTCVVSGYGNVAWGTIKKLVELGAKVITISGSDGYILDEQGITKEKVDFLSEMRRKKTGVEEYCKKYTNAKFFKGKKPWEVKGDIYIPCETQNEITMEDAKLLVNNKAKYLIEGSNMSTTNEAINYLKKEGVIVAPSKAANAGGVICSCIEMSQNARHEIFTDEYVYSLLEEAMINIHNESMDAAQRYNLGYDLIAGANIRGFERVAEGMMAQGVV